MRSALPLVFALAGCDLAFGLGDRIEPDAPPEEDAPLEIDAPTPCVEREGEVVAIADAMIIHEGTCDPANRWGASRNVNIGQGGASGTRSRVLLRFALTATMREGLESGFVRGTLTIPLQPDACAAPCPSSAIGISMFAAHDDWNEGEETNHIGVGWCARKQLQPSPPPATPWQAQGADGLLDRSQQSLGDAMITSVQAQAASIEIPFGDSAAARADLVNWIAGSELTVLLIPTTPTGTLYTKAHEHPGGGGAKLTITSCR